MINDILLTEDHDLLSGVDVRIRCFGQYDYVKRSIGDC